MQNCENCKDLCCNNCKYDKTYKGNAGEDVVLGRNSDTSYYNLVVNPYSIDMNSLTIEEVIDNA